MPIIGINSQPTINSLKAAYRPISFVVEASSDSGAEPPVVYCDIYINGVFYKTISKTQWVTIGLESTTWYFDIQDACQELLIKNIGDNSGMRIVPLSTGHLYLRCKFRASSYNSDGFIEPEGDVPIQGTGKTSPTPGGGTASHHFYVVNSALQHEDNQDLKTHLEFFRSGVWDDFGVPLTHRPDGYMVCKTSSDYFPMFYFGDSPKCIKVHYKYKKTSYAVTALCKGAVPCIALAGIGAFAPPDGVNGRAYMYSYRSTGALPFALGAITKPSWMTVTLDGNTIRLTGTPVTGDGQAISISLSNCSGGNTIVLTSSIDITDVPVCVTPFNTNSLTLPDASVGDSYSFNIPFGGDTPLSISAIVKPNWMTISLIGSTVFFGGTPNDPFLDQDVSFVITNACGTFNFVDFIDANVVYGCDDFISESFAGTSTTTFYYNLNLPDGAHTLDWNSFDRPNGFAILKQTGEVVADTGWKGYAPYPGPWGSSLSTITSGVLAFTMLAGISYKLRVSVGNASPSTSQSDNFEVTLNC